MCLIKTVIAPHPSVAPVSYRLSPAQRSPSPPNRKLGRESGSIPHSGPKEIPQDGAYIDEWRRLGVLKYPSPPDKIAGDAFSHLCFLISLSLFSLPVIRLPAFLFIAVYFSCAHSVGREQNKREKGLLWIKKRRREQHIGGVTDVLLVVEDGVELKRGRGGGGGGRTEVEIEVEINNKRESVGFPCAAIWHRPSQMQCTSLFSPHRLDTEYKIPS